MSVSQDCDVELDKAVEGRDEILFVAFIFEATDFELVSLCKLA